MAYSGKTNWQNNEIVEASDMNRIEQGISDVDAGLGNVQTEVTTHKADNTAHGVDTKIPKTLATAADQFLVSSAASNWVVKTVEQIKTLLGLKSAAYTESSAYAPSSHIDASASTSAKGHVQLSASTTSTSTSLAATASAVKTVNDALTSHKADNAAHNGFVGKAKVLSVSDFNLLIVPGIYHGVLNITVQNEPYTGASARRVTVVVRQDSSGYNIMQEIFYENGTWEGRIYRRNYDVSKWSPWLEIKTSRDIKRGQGSPEGVISATVGTLYQRTDVGELYVKKTGTGNTGWTMMYNPTNITVSTSAPGSALAEGFQHQVY